MAREALTCPPSVARQIEHALASRGAPVERLEPCVWRSGPVLVIFEVRDELPRLRVEIRHRIRIGYVEPGWERWLEAVAGQVKGTTL